MEITGTLVPLPADFEEPMDFKDTLVPETEIPSPAVTEPPLALMVLPEMVMLVPAVSLSCFPATVVCSVVTVEASALPVCNAEISPSQVPTRITVVDESI